MSKIVFISCVSKKLPYRAKAKDLYISDLFKKSLAYARMIKPDKIFILSAEYGLVGLEEELEPYEQTLNNMKSHEVQQWAEMVRGQMAGQVNFEADQAVFLAGERYRKYLLPLFKHANVPMEGLSIGRQLQWLKERLVGQSSFVEPRVKEEAKPQVYERPHEHQPIPPEPPPEDKEPPFERPGLRLVPSGGEVPTRDTAAVMHSLIEESMNEVVLVGYTVYKGKLLFEPLATKMSNNPDLKVSFCLNIQRNFGDTSLDSEIVKRFAQDFSTNHWPWNPKPELFYDPRALQTGGNERASLHAKCLIVDRRIAMVTSANFTEAAHSRNVEVGIVTRYEPFVERLATYFDTMKKTVFKQCQLLS